MVTCCLTYSRQRLKMNKTMLPLTKRSTEVIATHLVALKNNLLGMPSLNQHQLLTYKTPPPLSYLIKNAIPPSILVTTRPAPPPPLPPHRNNAMPTPTSYTLQTQKPPRGEKPNSTPGGCVTHKDRHRHALSQHPDSIMSHTRNVTHEMTL